MSTPDFLAELSRPAPGLGWAYALGEKRFGLDALVPAPESAFDDTQLRGPLFVITDQSEDRDGDIVETAGGDLTHHKANPVVFFDHRRVLPFPVAVSETPEGVYTVELRPEIGKGYGTPYFKQDVRESVQIYQLCKSGLIRMASIAFLVKSAEPRKASGATSGVRRPLRIKIWELTEWTLTGVGANRHAVRAELQKGLIAGSPISDGLRAALEPHAAEKDKAWANGVELPADPPLKLAEGERLVLVTCPKSAFAGPEDARTWCQSKGYVVTDGMSEGPEGDWSFRQPGDPCDPATSRGVSLAAGCIGLVAKALVQPTPDEPLPPAGCRAVAQVADWLDELCSGAEYDNLTRAQTAAARAHAGALRKALAGVAEPEPEAVTKALPAVTWMPAPSVLPPTLSPAAAARLDVLEQTVPLIRRELRKLTGR